MGDHKKGASLNMSDPVGMARIIRSQDEEIERLNGWVEHLQNENQTNTIMMVEQNEEPKRLTALLEQSASDQEKIKRMDAALNFIWHQHLNSQVHLGMERFSGVEQGCIPCIAAAGLDRGADKVSGEQILNCYEQLTTKRNDP